MTTRIGFGWDSHAFKPGVPLRIGGLTIDHPEGSPATPTAMCCCTRSPMPAGAVAAGDIGSFFRRATPAGRTRTRPSS